MGRSFVLAVICGLCMATSTDAAPFDQLARRLQAYDDHEGRSSESVSPARVASYQEELPPASPSPAPMRGELPVSPREWQDNGPTDFLDESCSDNYCCQLGRAPGAWGRAELLYWWVRGSKTPPLVTTSPNNGILPGATVLFGDDRLNQAGRSGGRFTLGYWFDDCQPMGLESNFLFIGRSSDGFFANSDGTTLLARPFFNVATGLQDANLVAVPNNLAGSITVASSRQLLGAEMNLRRTLFADCCRRFDVLAGFRYFRLQEGLQINSDATTLNANNPNIPIGTTFDILDAFSTTNNFYGGQLGLNVEFEQDRWALDLLAKVALGGMAQHVSINGSTVVTVPNVAPATSVGGILALPSNIGSFRQGRFAALPEFAANLHYQLTPLWRLNLGYTLLLVGNVVRPGDQIDPRVDPAQLPPPTAAGTFPKFSFVESQLWLQGINFGIECNF